MRLALALLAAALGLAPVAALAAEAEVPLLEARVDLDDKPSLQRGAQVFVNYCLSCHGAQYMRYQRLGDDLGIPEDLLEENLMFTTDKPGDVMTVAMRAQDGEKWFGVAPPDLSVIARARGADWLYSYLLAFYEDPARPFGVNNLVFAETAMPAVLVGLQGLQVLNEAEDEAAHDGAHGEEGLLERLELAQPGELSPAEFRRSMRDLVSFLVYLGEPAKLVRYGVGLWVLLFVALLFVLSYALYKEYWKDVH